MTTLIRRFIRDDAGQDMIEYAVLTAFISIIAWAIIQTIGNDVSTLFTNIQSATGVYIPVDWKT